ncbi:MAG: translocation/assembly module TamB domain-containing protein, partial [Nitrospiria bacterium]
GAVVLVGGTLNAPAGHGTLTVREGHLALKIRKITLDHVRADVRLEGPRLILESFSATRGGTVTGHGRYDPNGWDLALTADRLVVLDDGVSHATAAGTLRLTVDAARRRADGTIRLTDVRLPLPSLSAPKAGPTKQAIASEVTVVGLAEPDGVPDTGAPSSPAPDWEGTVRIEVPRDAWAKGADGQIELAGAVDLRLAGTGLPGIEGEFRVLRGFYRLFGVKLDLESGVVRFSGIRELNPLIDITAQRKLDHYTLRVHAGGTARKPTVSFSSDPPLEQTEIVSLLATGKTTEQLTQGERSSLGRSVGSVVSSAAVGELRKALGRRVPVDTIDVETGEDGQSDARITVGKYVSEDVFVKYGQAFGSGAGSEMGIEWSISDKLTLETERRGDGNTGMDLFYTLKY